MLRGLIVFVHADGDAGDALEKEMARWVGRSANKWRSSAALEVYAQIDRSTIHSILSPGKDTCLLVCWSHGRYEDGALLSASRTPYVDQVNCSLLARQRTIAFCCHSHRLLNHVSQRLQLPRNLYLGFTEKFHVVLNRSRRAYDGFEESCSAALDTVIQSGNMEHGKREFQKVARRSGWLAMVRSAWYRMNGEKKLGAGHFLCMLAHAYNRDIVECC